MNSRIFSVLFLLSAISGSADVFIDEPAFGGSLGGWAKKSGKAAQYSLSGADYRTYRPEITPTPDGGIFISVRIDHVRGWLSSNDHAMLEITVDKNGEIASAQSSIAIQGRSVTSDLIRGSKEAGDKAVGTDRALEIGTNLVADISEKLLREKIVEAGRVSFPSALRHNYNLLYQALRKKTFEVVVDEVSPEVTPGVSPEVKGEEGEAAARKGKGLEIKQYVSGENPQLIPEP